MVPETQSERDKFFCHFGPFFALLLLKNPENLNFGKMKKTPPEDIIISYMCTKIKII